MTEIPRRPGGSVRVRVHEHNAGEVRSREDRVVTEEPLEIRLAAVGTAAQRAVVTMRTPGHDFELATGWAVHEGLIAPDQVQRVAYCTDDDLSDEERFNVVTIVARTLMREPQPRALATSACGVCGSASIAAAFNHLHHHTVPEMPIPALTIEQVPELMRGQQALFGRTGGIHAAALFSPAADLLVLREDVGRHNAVDKLTGAQVLGHREIGGEVLGTSGRIGFEIVQKAIASRRTAVVGVGAPTSLAVRLAREAGLVMAGFTRANRFVLYSGEDRVTT